MTTAFKMHNLIYTFNYILNYFQSDFRCWDTVLKIKTTEFDHHATMMAFQSKFINIKG